MLKTNRQCAIDRHLAIVIRDNITMVYINEEDQRISVKVIEDCGNMQDSKGNTWRKVICKPIGFNNSIPMILDYNKLVMDVNQ